MMRSSEYQTVGDRNAPFALARALDSCAKWWWGASFLFQGLSFAAGISVVLPIPAEPIPFIVAAFTLISLLSMYRSDAIKSLAQGLRRKLDLYDSFGWEIPPLDYSDLCVRCPRSAKVRARLDGSVEPYFLSTELQGPVRALENVSESAWWSKHLAERMRSYCIVLMATGLVVSVIVLIVALQTVGQSDVRASVARIVAALLMFLFSAGVVRLGMGYHELAKSAERSEQDAINMNKSGEPKLVDTLRVMSEYHLARAVGPLIPTWVWNCHRDELNAVWLKYHATRTSQC